MAEQRGGGTTGREGMWLVSPPPQHQQKFDPLHPQFSPHCISISQPCPPCTVAVWRSKLVQSLLSPSRLLPAIQGSPLHPPPPTDKLGDPLSSRRRPNLICYSPPFKRLQTHCVNDARLGAGKSFPSSSADCNTKSFMFLHRNT